METKICNAPVPVMPALWPSVHNIRPDKGRSPSTVNGPKRISYYLEPLKDIASHPERAEILRHYFNGKIV